jgi:hypothetical protein
MYVPFRQGLVRHQVDTNSNPAFLQKASGGQYINLVVSPTPAVICFAHSTTNYLYEETKTVNGAWGPFTGSTTRWLYWDLDMLTGARTFGSTTTLPTYSSTPPATPVLDQHWFDQTHTTMFVWNGTRWDEKIRCFAARYDNSAVLIPNASGSQAGLNTPVNAGFILFDDDEKPIKKWKRDNRGFFLTTETPLITHASRVSNVVLDGTTKVCQAHHNIPQWSVVALNDFNTIELASHLDQSKPAAGITKWNMNVGDVGVIHTSGYITNNNWNWTVPASTSLFVGLSGQITPVVPQVGSIQRIGMVVDSDTIYVDVGMHIILDES